VNHPFDDVTETRTALEIVRESSKAGGDYA
jgi:hypothetical protein